MKLQHEVSHTLEVWDTYLPEDTMHFTPNNIYHIYNRGNDKQMVFFKRENYLYFLKKVRKYVLPHCDILSYCLMPNHFHIVVYTDERIEEPFNNQITKNKLSEGIRLLLSSYTKGINVQEGKTGNLFQQKTKAKCITDNFSKNYPEVCFHYVHQNPRTAKLVSKLEDWEFSSFKDYAGLREGTLSNQELAFELLNLSKIDFYEDSYNVILSDADLTLIF
ncbi:MAG: transposase [Daejeonella sp.]|nr:transposase [Daejeonella sp.]